MKPKSGFLCLAEELQCYILTFFACRDILRCTSVCKALRQTYMSSSELQYIVELSGQGLLPVRNADNHTSAAERLQLLRDKSHAWFKADSHSLTTVHIPNELYHAYKFVIDGHLYLWNAHGAMAIIIPVPPKLSQHTIEHDWLPRELCSIPNTHYYNILMDPAQNLIVLAHRIPGGPVATWPPEATLYFELRALYGGGVHPQAAGQRLFLSGLPGYEDCTVHSSQSVMLKNFGRYIALSRLVTVWGAIPTESMWQLQIWDWQHSMTSNSVLIGTLQNTHHKSIDYCFLGNNRLLVFTAEDLKIYSFEDISQRPQLLACFRMPIALPNVECIISTGDIAHSPEMQTMNTSDPKHRLLCLTTSGIIHYTGHQVYIISTRIFFDLDGMAATTPIPWEHWGPSNARIFQNSQQCKVDVSGSRVLLAFTVGTPALRVMDFSPLAVTNRRGLGRVVNEPSTIDIDPTHLSRETLTITTSLPYVEVVLDKKFGPFDLESIRIDMDRIYLLFRTVDGWLTQTADEESEVEDSSDVTPLRSRLEVIYV